MIALGPWRPDTPRPSDAAHVRGCWQMADIGAQQHPSNVRALWDGDEPLALGGLVEMDRDAMAFVWWRADLSPMIWRRILPALTIGLTLAHERGIRRIFAIVAAAHAAAIRLLKRLGFVFACNETGWPNTTEPMLRYCRARPEILEPALVAHQRRELELACLAAWCPELAT